VSRTRWAQRAAPPYTGLVLGLDVVELIERLAGNDPAARDLVLSVGVPPLVRRDGDLHPAPLPGIGRLTPFATETLALHLLAHAPHAASRLRERGTASFVVARPGRTRYRVTLMRQRGTLVASVRLLPRRLPELDSLGLPAEVAEAASLRAGLVLVGGPAGSGTSTTLAALVGRIAAERPCHVVTVEDPIEHLLPHRRAVVHQREVGIDVPDHASGVADAVRLGADVIALSEVPDGTTAALALDAAEAGHLVIGVMRGLDSAAVVERLVGLLADRPRERALRQVASALQAVFVQRLVRSRDGATRPVVEVWRNLPATRTLLERGDLTAEAFADALRDAMPLGARPLDAELERLVRAGTIDRDTALAEAAVPHQLELRLLDMGGRR